MFDGSACKLMLLSDSKVLLLWIEALLTFVEVCAKKRCIKSRSQSAGIVNK
jgi:hypothetical protein